MPPAIVLDRVTKRFPRMNRPAVAECSLTVEPGEFLVLLGTSGSGKTTLLKMVNRIHEPTSGRILLGGVDTRTLPVTQLRRRIGYVIQQIGLFPHQTVAQNIATVPRILGWDQRRIAERVDFLLDLVHLPPEQYRHRRPRQLSGGQQQRVGIARALAGDPEILLMDEPFGALDAITRSSLQDELRRIQQEFRKTVLFVTHDVAEALKLGDRIVVMQEGQIVQVDTPLRLLTRPATPYVRQLLGADDILQRLSLVPVESIMVQDAAGPADGSAAGSVKGNAGAGGAATGGTATGGAATGGAATGDAAALPPPLPAGSSLREALAALLQSGAVAVTITDAAGRPLGRVGWQEIRQVTAQGAEGAQGS